MKKNIVLILIVAVLMPFYTAAAETLPLEGKVVSTQSCPIISQAKGTVEQINYTVGDRISAMSCIASLTTVKVYAPVAGTVCMWGKAGDSIIALTEQYGAVACIEPTNPYTIRTKPQDANGKSVPVHPGQKVYLICMNDGKKTGEGVITSIGNDEYTVQVENSNFDANDTISIYTTPDHRTSNRIGRGSLTKAGITACTGTGYIVKTYVTSGVEVQKGQILYETIEGDFAPGSEHLNQLTVPENGVVATISIEKGKMINVNDVAAVIYPDSNMRVRALAPESVLCDYKAGDTVYIVNQFHDGNQPPLTGIIEKISQIPEQTESAYDMYYAVYIKIQDNSTLFYGMNVLVYAQNPYQGVPEGE